MTGRANTFRYWGVSMDEIKLNRDEIAGLEFENPKGAHGKKDLERLMWRLER